MEAEKVGARETVGAGEVVRVERTVVVAVIGLDDVCSRINELNGFLVWGMVRTRTLEAKIPFPLVAFAAA